MKSTNHAFYLHKFGASTKEHNQSKERKVPGVQRLNCHRTLLYGSVASASIPPDNTKAKEKIMDFCGIICNSQKTKQDGTESELRSTIFLALLVTTPYKEPVTKQFEYPVSSMMKDTIEW